MYCNEVVAKFLFEHGAKVDAMDSGGHSASDWSLAGARPSNQAGKEPDHQAKCLSTFRYMRSIGVPDNPMTEEDRQLESGDKK